MAAVVSSVLVEVEHVVRPVRGRSPWSPAALWAPVRECLGRDRPVEFPWVAAALAGGVLLTGLVVGAYAHEIPASLGDALGVGWPTLRRGEWWTLASSFVLTRDPFMAATMPVCLFAGIALYERRAGHLRALTVAFVGHVTATVLATVTLLPLLLTHVPTFVRAVDNVDYGASMAIAASIGALLAFVDDRRLTVVVLGVALAGTLAHHQMSDWGHVVALPLGYAFGSLRDRHAALLAGTALVGATVLATAACAVVVV